MTVTVSSTVTVSAVAYGHVVFGVKVHSSTVSTPTVSVVGTIVSAYPITSVASC